MWEFDSEKRVLGKNVNDLWQKGIIFDDIIDEIIKDGGWVGELNALRDNGTLFPVQISASIVKNEKNFPICLMISFVDVTEQKRMERNYKKFKTISDRAEYGSIIYDYNGYIFYVNLSFAKMHGYKIDELIGKNISIFYQKNHYEIFKKLNRELNKCSSFSGKELWHKRKNGQIFPILMTSTAIKDDNKNLIFFAATIIDITDIKNVEKELQDYAEELKTKNDELQNIQEKLAELNSNLELKVKQRTGEVMRLLNQKDAFINQLSHDLKTPLTPIIALLPILRSYSKDEDSKELISIFEKNVNCIKTMVDKTIDLAKYNSKDFSLIFQNINLYLYINKFIEKYMKNKYDNIQIKNNIDTNIFVMANPSKLYQICDIIFSNALKYSEENKIKIKINAETDDNIIVLSISDNGIGMTKEQMDHIFEEFYKVDESRHDLRSHGLSLTICKKIVEHHGGRIWAKSSGPGKGSTFYFTLKKGVSK
jgi:PAS domain S-box-containing protein